MSKSTDKRPEQPEPVDTDGYLTVAEVAQIARVDIQTMYRLVRRGKVASKRFGGVLRVPRSAIIDSPTV